VRGGSLVSTKLLLFFDTPRSCAVYRKAQKAGVQSTRNDPGGQANGHTPLSSERARMEHSIPQQAHVTFLDRTGSAFGSRAEHVCSRACRFACACRAALARLSHVPSEGSAAMPEDLVPLR